MTTPTLTTDHLRLFRKHFSLRQDQAAQLLGVTRVTWCRWESGRYPLPGYLLHSLRSVVQDLKQQQQQNTERATLGL
ncbi:helix-turn-helix domain-containing protein [Sulfurimonas sp.]|uniref:helix-turn-helix domain-containing protein n=1 Tax=Sulfurimonas sp. TaxID=2022749 RepID=UPI00356341D9